MEPIDIKTFSGVEYAIAQKCDDGDGFLNEEEYSIFNKAKEEFASPQSQQTCTINGIKYYYITFLKTLIEYPKQLMEKLTEQPDAISTKALDDAKTNAKIEEMAATWNNVSNNSSSNLYDDYDEDAGNRLANTAYNNRNKRKIRKHGKWTYFLGKCKAFVRRAMERAGFGTIGGNNGYEAMADLRNNKNFREIAPAESVDLSTLPNGAILVYYPDKIRKGKEPNKYDYTDGHIEITRKNPKTGKVEGVSDGVGSLRNPDAIFIPIKVSETAGDTQIT